MRVRHEVAGVTDVRVVTALGVAMALIADTLGDDPGWPELLTLQASRLADAKAAGVDERAVAVTVAMLAGALAEVLGGRMEQPANMILELLGDALAVMADDPP